MRNEYNIYTQTCYYVKYFATPALNLHFTSSLHTQVVNKINILGTLPCCALGVQKTPTPLIFHFFLFFIILARTGGPN